MLGCDKPEPETLFLASRQAFVRAFSTVGNVKQTAAKTSNKLIKMGNITYTVNIHTDESCYIIKHLGCDYTFPIDSAPNGIPFGAKLIGKV